MASGLVVKKNGQRISQTRADVKAGQVFAVLNKGKMGKRRYGAIGHNGKFYSVDLTNGLLSGTANGKSSIAIVGSWGFAKTMFPATRFRDTTRKNVKVGEIFRVAGGAELYAHMGEGLDGRARKFISVHLDAKQNHAATTNGDSNVTVVGTVELDAKVVE